MFCYEQLAHGFETQCYIQLRFGENSMRIERDQEEQALGKPQSTSSHIRRLEMEIFLLSVIRKGKGLLSPSVYYDLCFANRKDRDIPSLFHCTLVGFCVLIIST